MELFAVTRPWRGFSHPLCFVGKQTEDICLAAARFSLFALQAIWDTDLAERIRSIVAGESVLPAEHADR